jgi:hypothetical protein
MSNPKSHALRQNDRISFFQDIDRFLEKTTEYVHLGANPGDYYKAIWSRDAAFILKDQFLTGDTYNVLRTLYFIWAHQIDPDNGERIIYGRGSPDLDFSIQNADEEAKKRFAGALPSTIYHNQGFSEVYAFSPDIDSTALMISTTSWILDVYLKAGLYSYYQTLSEWATVSTSHDPLLPPLNSARPISSADYNKEQLFPFSEQEPPKPPTSFEQLTSPLKIISKPTELIEFIVPRMLNAVNYLAGRDIDGDGLLEQGYNEDWMDTALRSGKIVYSQACWILALSNCSSLLYTVGEQDAATRLTEMAERTVYAVEEKLWSEQDSAYIDLKFDGVSENHRGEDNDDKILTQDVSLYLVSITENTFSDILSMRFKNNDNQAATGNAQKPGKDAKNNEQRPRILHKGFEHRAVSTLETIKNRIWVDGTWPLVTEKELKKTGPWRLDPNQYHNHTFWPWMTGIEILARSRFQRYHECNALLSALTRGSHPKTLAFYEWVNPKPAKGMELFHSGRAFQQ